MTTRSSSTRARRSTMASPLNIPKDLLLKIMGEYLTIVEWSRFDIALCTYHDIRSVFLEALKSEVITLSVLNNLFWDLSLKKGVLKWIIAKGIHIISWENKHYSHLKNIRMSESAVSFKTLFFLDISVTSITESILLSLLKRLPNLEELYISSCFNIMDAGIKAIATGLSNLKLLNIRKCLHVTDDGIAMLAEKLPNLSQLCISCCAKITNVGLMDIATRLTNIKSLDISGIKITDAGISEILNGLSGPNKLQSLFISQNNEITDKAVTEIVNRLTNLQLLDISACDRITDKVIGDIRTRVPTLRLIR